MKKIRILSLCLAVLMLLGSLSLLSSCKRASYTLGEITLSEKTQQLDMTGYIVLYGKSQSETDFTDTVREQFKLFVSRLSEATGANFKLKAAEQMDAGNTR